MTRIPVRNPDSDDDQQWEDLPDEKWAPNSRSSTPSGWFKGTASAAGARRTRQRAISPSTSPRKHNPGDYRTHIRARRERSLVELPLQDMGTARPEHDFSIRPFLQEPKGYLLGVVVRMMKLPFSIVLVVIVCAYALSIPSGAVSSALSPICSTPILSLLCPTSKSSRPARRSNPERTPQLADFLSLLNMESRTFESLLDNADQGPGVALEIKKAGMATSDLMTLVRVSNLDSRAILAHSLSEFVKDAHKAGRGLTRFSSEVGSTVDRYVYLLFA